MTRWRPSTLLPSFLLLSALPVGVFGADILKTDGFSMCGTSDIKIERMQISYDNALKKVVFDVAGTSNKEEKVMAVLKVLAYGKEVYTKEFDPCDSATKVDQLCPIPKGSFAAKGSQDVPLSYAKQIPGIAFSVPDLDGTARLELKAKDGGKTVACVQSSVGNGKTMSTKAVPAIAAGIAGCALIVSALSSLGAAGQPGASTPSPSFFEVMTWFQGIAMNGMMSVDYPPVYRSFTKNFGFSTGLISWDVLGQSIDDFRAKTGGNLTEDSVDFLKNATLVYQKDGNLTKRSLEMLLFARQITTSVGNNGTNGTSSDQKQNHFVQGIQAYAEQLAIPKSNTFMQVLMVLAIVIAAIIVGILLFKVILEAWALCGQLPKSLHSTRRRYWIIIAKTITQLIFLLYGVWTLYCIFQFTQGDSWAAKVLAGVTLAVFTIVLAWFTWRIWSLARRFKATEGDTSGLYDNKKVWQNYSIFYDSYKKGYWWLFIPVIVYMFAKGVIIAGADGHGMFQTGGQLILEVAMLVLLLWLRPFTLKSSNVINIVIQVVRVLSVLCILVFVQQLHIEDTPKTVVGLVLVVVQAVLTGILFILIVVNALVMCFKTNPHRKARKEAEKNRGDNLTPLDARNSLLLNPDHYKKNVDGDSDVESAVRQPMHYRSNNGGSHARQFSDESDHGLSRERSPLPSVRAPLLPQVTYDQNMQYQDARPYEPYRHNLDANTSYNNRY